MARILMCRPDHFGIEYEINAWMRRDRPAAPSRAVEQWNRLEALLRTSGATIELLEPVPGLPDYVFTANASLILDRHVVMSRFRHHQRQHEVSHARAWFTADGFEVHDLDEGMYFEGAGDALFCGETLYAGYRIRSDAVAHQWIAQRFGIAVAPLELVDARFYHLDTCFCPLRPGQAIYFPEAFDHYGRRVLESTIDDLIAVDEVEAQRFACNAVVLGETVITNEGCPRLHDALAERGYDPKATALDEYLKAGGSAKCLTLRLDGEDAAVWKLRNAGTPTVPVDTVPVEVDLPTGDAGHATSSS